MELGLEGKVALVTGSSGGIGLETARLLAAEGASVVSSSRGSDGPGELHVAADLARPGEPERVVKAAEERYGRVDILVNNVGWAEIHRFDELTEEIWERSWQINVMSAVRASQAALPGMRERRAGAIVNVASTAAKRPSLGMPEYSVTKAAMLSLSRLIADLYAKDGIRCNAVTPGPTATEAWVGDGGLADQQGDRVGDPRQGRGGAPPRPARHSRGDRERDRLPGVGPRELRDRRRLERRRRHRPDHPLAPTTRQLPNRLRTTPAGAAVHAITPFCTATMCHPFAPRCITGVPVVAHRIRFGPTKRITAEAHVGSAFETASSNCRQSPSPVNDFSAPARIAAASAAVGGRVARGPEMVPKFVSASVPVSSEPDTAHWPPLFTRSSVCVATTLPPERTVTTAVACPDDARVTVIPTLTGLPHHVAVE